MNCIWNIAVCFIVALTSPQSSLNLEIDKKLINNKTIFVSDYNNLYEENFHFVFSHE